MMWSKSFFIPGETEAQDLRRQMRSPSAVVVRDKVRKARHFSLICMSVVVVVVAGCTLTIMILQYNYCEQGLGRYTCVQCMGTWRVWVECPGFFPEIFNLKFQLQTNNSSGWTGDEPGL